MPLASCFPCKGLLSLTGSSCCTWLWQTLRHPHSRAGCDGLQSTPSILNDYGLSLIPVPWQWFYGAQITYKTAVLFYKEAMLFLYLRLFPSKRFRRVCFTLIGLVTSSGVAFILVTIWQCQPLAAFWDKTLLKQPGAHCISSEAFWFSYSVINIIFDFSTLLLPVPEVLQLQMPWRDKVAIVGVFSLGLLYVPSLPSPPDATVPNPLLPAYSVCATSIIRTTTLPASAQSPDPTWGIIPATIWSVVEANTGTICACLPMLKQPLSVLFPRLFPSRSTTLGPIGSEGGTSYPWRLRGEHRSRSTKKTPSYTGAGGAGGVAHYQQWVLREAALPPGKADRSPCGSEDCQQLTADTAGILRTMDVDVSYRSIGRGSSDGSVPARVGDAAYLK